VISCAGEGRRLGLGRTKALVSLLGRPLILWNLEMLSAVEDVVVVVGYRAREVIDLVSAQRSDVIFAFNRDYASTGTAASFALGCAGAEGDVISLDGDLLVDPSDFASFLRDPTPCLGVAPPSTSEPVLVQVSASGAGRVASAFSYRSGSYESTGLVRLPAAVVHEAAARREASGHVFQMLESRLPLAVREVNAREIDTCEDYERAVSWLEPLAGRWGAAEPA
jgi:choline kinase